MALQANVFLLLFGAIQGFLLSIALLNKRERHSSHIFLTLFLVVVGLQLTSKVITKVWLMQNVFFFYVLSYSLPLLAAPAIYLFIRSRTQGASFQRSDLLHAIPFGLMFVVCVLISSGFDGNYEYLNFDWVRGVAQLASLAIYYRLSRKFVDTPMLRQFLNYMMLAEAIIVITLVIMVRYYGRIPDVRLLFIVLTAGIYWITWKLMTDPSLLAVPNRYAHSGLKQNEAMRIEAALQTLMQEQKLFTDSRLTIDKLAVSLNTNRHHLSQVLNERIRRPYNEYICELRLDEAQQRLADPKSNRYTIAAIAHDAGFSNVSTFNEAFKKRYGTTPSASRKQL